MQAVWAQVLAPFLKLLALSVSLVGILLAVCLLARPARTLAYMRDMNRWVSSRRAMKPFEVPRSVERRVRGRRLWLGLVFAAVGAYALIVLLWNLDPAKVSAALGVDPKYSGTALAIEALRWALVAGSAVCVAVGLMMALAPRMLLAFEAWSNTWISSRRALQGADTMYLPLDRLVEQFPRAAALLILALSLAAAASSAVLLLER